MRLSEVSRSEIWGFFAGKSQIIAVRSLFLKEKVENCEAIRRSREEPKALYT